MKDLTSAFELAIEIAKRRFNEIKWHSSFVLLATELELKFVSDDRDEKWFELGTDTDIVLLIARHCPMMYVAKVSVLQTFKSIYREQFVYEIVADFTVETFCLRVEKIDYFFSWNTDVVSPEKFSLNDLFYATH